MSVNSSSSSNASLPPPHASSSVSLVYVLHSCVTSTVGTVSITTFTIINILFLLPLCILIIYLGVQRWRQQRSGTTMSHSDLFTYHMVVIELMSVVGSTLSCCSILTDLPEMMMPSSYLFSINISGHVFFHILTCVERYLAVVHPITYLSLRKPKGIRVRNITIGCVWLLCFAGTGFMSLLDQDAIVVISFCCLVLVLIVITFCSLSVLCVLIRPGPGEGGGGRQRVDQSKLRAFYTIMAILGVLLLRFGGSVVSTALYASLHLAPDRCAVWLSMIWYGLPSSLVLPLLFLHRAGKLRCWKNNNESGQGSE